MIFDTERRNSTATRTRRLAAIHFLHPLRAAASPDWSHIVSQVRRSGPVNTTGRRRAHLETLPKTATALRSPHWIRATCTVLLLSLTVLIICPDWFRVSEVTGLIIADVTTTTPRKSCADSTAKDVRHA